MVSELFWEVGDVGTNTFQLETRMCVFYSLDKYPYH